MPHSYKCSVTFGLAGCYLPDSVSGPIECSTRKELAELIRNELDVFDLPASLFREANIKRAWRHIAKHGGSSVHINLHHKANVLSFNGLTDDEFTSMESEAA